MLRNASNEVDVNGQKRNDENDLGNIFQISALKFNLAAYCDKNAASAKAERHSLLVDRICFKILTLTAETVRSLPEI